MPTDTNLTAIKAAHQNLTDTEILTSLMAIRSRLKEAKGEERSERARRYAITITELEKVMGYFQAFVVESDL